MAGVVPRAFRVAALGRRAMSAASMKATTRMARRPPPKAVLSLTDVAAQRVKDMLKENPTALGLRVGVTKGGCSGKSFDLSYAYDFKPHEELVKDKGVTIVVESTAIMNILHSTMDYEAKDEYEGFVFENPQAKGMCGCGASFVV